MPATGSTTTLTWRGSPKCCFYRELGFSLQDISVILDDPSTDVAVHLRRQKELLREHVERIEAKAAAITRALEAIAMNEPLSEEQAREIFGWWPSEDLAKRQRTRTGRPEGWDPLAGKTRAELEAMEAHRADFASRLLGAFESGEGPESPQAMDLAEEHFEDLRSVFECTYEIQAAICDGYVNERETFLFAVRPTEDRPGLAAFLRDAAQANAMRAGGHG